MNHLLKLMLAGTAMVLVAVAGDVRADAASDLFSAWTKMLDSRFTMEAVSTSGKGETAHMTGRYDTFERIHMTMDNMEFITVPEGTWINMNGKWMKPPFNASSMVGKAVMQSVADMRENTSNIVDHGMVDVDGQRLRAISFTQTASFMGIKSTADTKVFIDGTDRIVRTESDSKARRSSDRSVQTITYDDSVRVNPPN